MTDTLRAKLTPFVLDPAACLMRKMLLGIKRRAETNTKVISRKAA